MEGLKNNVRATGMEHLHEVLGLLDHSPPGTVPAKTAPLKCIKAIPRCHQLGHKSCSISGFSQEEVLLGSRGIAQEEFSPLLFLRISRDPWRFLFFQ